MFRINPEELFQIIEDIIGNADASYEPRRQSERFGKTLLWLITDSDTGKQTMMFAEDYDEVLLKFAHDNDSTCWMSVQNISPDFTFVVLDVSLNHRAPSPMTFLCR